MISAARVWTGVAGQPVSMFWSSSRYSGRSAFLHLDRDLLFLILGNAAVSDMASEAIYGEAEVMLGAWLGLSYLLFAEVHEHILVDDEDRGVLLAQGTACVSGMASS